MATPEDDPFTLDLLPFDCLVTICEYLTAKDLARMSRVCKVRQWATLRMRRVALYTEQGLNGLPFCRCFVMQLKLATCGGMYSTHTHTCTCTHNHMRRLIICPMQLVVFYVPKYNLSKLCTFGVSCKTTLLKLFPIHAAHWVTVCHLGLRAIRGLGSCDS